MIQQALQENVISRETTHETHSGSGIRRLLTTILKGGFKILGKIVASVGEGFLIFVGSAEQHGLPRGQG